MAFAIGLLSDLLLAVGALLVLVTGIALLRLPDYYSRVHGASIGDTAGAGFLLAGLALISGFSLVTVKLAMVIVFLILTGPVAAYALARSALTHGIEPAAGAEDEE